jgi:hypothetical protein
VGTSLTDGGEDEVRGVRLSAHCCISMQSPLDNIKYPKTFVGSENVSRSYFINIHVNEVVAWRQEGNREKRDGERAQPQSTFRGLSFAALGTEEM